MIADYNPDLNIYFPTINRQDIAASSTSLFFGGIDYRAQIDALVSESTTPMVIFYDKSRLGQELHDYTKDRYMNPVELNVTTEEPSLLGNPDEEMVREDMQQEPKVTYSFDIEKHTSNLEKQLKENEKIQNASFVLNTPIVKSGMIMSQLTLYDTNVTNILSTQINYDPLHYGYHQT